MHMLKMWHNVIGAKLPVTTHGYYMVKIARLNNAFSEFLKLEAGPVESQSLQQQKIRKGEKGQAQKNK